MTSWEHRRCGTVFHTRGQAAPADCGFCLSGYFFSATKFASPAQSTETGWRRVRPFKVQSVASGKSAVTSTSVPVKQDPKQGGNPRNRDRGRRSPSAYLRGRVYQRDGYRCVECGCDDKAQLTIDHKIPWSKDGRTTYKNLQTLCISCNRAKGDEMPEPNHRSRSGPSGRGPVAEMTGWADN